jgi:hypothetical protein
VEECRFMDEMGNVNIVYVMSFVDFADSGILEWTQKNRRCLVGT